MSVLCDKDITELCKKEPPLIDKYYDWEWQLQPAGFDLSVDRIFVLDSPGTIYNGRKTNLLPKKHELTCNDEGLFELAKGHYVVQFCEKLCLPNNVMALGKPRSTLLRYGGTLATGIWDPGFHGISQCGLIVYNDKGINISKGASLLHMTFLLLSGESSGFQYNDIHKAVVNNK
jgi:dUTP pyrophosphatase